MTGTYCSRPWVGDLPSVLSPLVIMTMFVGEGSVEDVADISHRVDADRRALEHRAERETMNVREGDTLHPSPKIKT